jgi:hypothetical protein
MAAPGNVSEKNVAFGFSAPPPPRSLEMRLHPFAGATEKSAHFAEVKS